MCFGKFPLTGKQTRKERSDIFLKNEDEKAKYILEIQIKEVEKEIGDIKTVKTGRIYEVARRVRHGKKAA